MRYSDAQARICFDTFNAEAELQRVIYTIDSRSVRRWPTALYSLIQSRRIQHYEAELCRAADCVIAVSPEDAALLGVYLPDKQVHIVPSGITSDDYAKSSAAIDLGQHSIVFTGKMDYRPNVDAMLWFHEAILPAIRARIPDSHLTIVGQKPHPRLQALIDGQQVSLTGWVDSVLPYLHAADVYVAPLRMGSGTRLKILEAMACGCAIVATSIAAAGLNDALRDALVIADEPQAMSDAVVRLLGDPDERQALGQQARQAVRQHYDWGVIIPRLLDAYRETGLG